MVPLWGAVFDKGCEEMVQFTKKLIYCGNSKGILLPPEIIQYLDLQIGDFVTLDVIEVKKR